MFNSKPMKKLTLFACALCMSVCAMAQTAFYVYKTDGSRVEYAIADVDSISFTAPAVSIENGHEYVDLGLPSGTKWATCNVGATSPEEYGDYYAWGETEPKTTYSWRTYKYGPYYGELTKYCTDSDYGKDGFVDNKTVLELADDAARVNWGGQWRMPTDDEWTELRENCTWTWTNLNGKNGYEVKGANGNSIFLPAAGYRDGFDSYYGYYWSSSLRAGNPDDAWGVYFGSDDVSRGSDGRCCGRSVRPVLK